MCLEDTQPEMRKNALRKTVNNSMCKTGVGWGACVKPGSQYVTFKCLRRDTTLCRSVYYGGVTACRSE